MMTGGGAVAGGPQPAQHLEGSLPRQRPTGRVSPALALLPAGGVVGVLFVYPLTRLVLDSITVGDGLGLQRYTELLGSAVFWSIAWRTVRTSLIVTGLCLVFGFPVAYALSRLPSRWATPLLLVVTLPFFVSVLIRSYAWLVILGPNGPINRMLVAVGLSESGIRLVHNEIGALIGMVHIQLPLMILPIYSVMRRVNRALVLAAQSLGAPPASAFWHVFVPLSSPGVTAGASLVFVTCLGFFITPALLGGPGDYLIAQAIEVRVNTFVDFGAAAAYATILLLAALGLMFALRGPLGLHLYEQAEAQRPEARTEPNAGPHSWWGARLHGLRPWSIRRGPQVCTWRRLSLFLSACRKPVVALASGTTLAFLLLPLGVIVPLAFSDAPYLTFPPDRYSLRWFSSYFGDPAWMEATRFSLYLAASSALFASAIGTLAALSLVRTPIRVGSLVHLLYMSPLIVPHMVVAVALFFFMAALGLIGHPLGFIGAYVMFGIPYVLVVMTAALRRFDQALEHAAASLGASPLRTFMTVTLPLLAPAIASAFLFAFLAAFDDLVVALFLSAPGAVTLPIRMWEDIRLEISPRLAAVSVLLMTANAGLFLAVAAYTKGKTWRGAHAPHAPSAS